MARIKQSFCLGLFLKKDMKLDDLIRRAKEMGYAAVEIWQRDKAPFNELVEVTQKHNLSIASMSGHQSLPDGLNKPENHKRIQDELAESIEVAAKLGIKGLITFSGNRHAYSDEESIEICAAGLRPVMKLAEEKGVNLNMELLNSIVNHKGYQCDHTAWGVKVCQAAGSPRAKLLYDIYHMQIMEGNLIANIKANIQYIGHFHTAGVPGRGPLDERQEIYYPAVCRAIAETGYELYVGHEFGSSGDPYDALAAAYKTCNV